MRFNKNEAWSFGKSNRNNLNKNDTPGPGNYEMNSNKTSPKWK